MRFLLATLSVLTATLASAITASAPAQGAVPTMSCEPVLRELDESRRALNRATTELERAQAAANQLRGVEGELERTTRNLQEATAATHTCQEANQQLCTAVGQFAAGIGSGRLNTAGVEACVASNTQHTLVEQLSGWSNANTALTQISAYVGGETDAFPRLGPTSGTKAEKIIARLLSQGGTSPLLYRRLLVEALKLIAPRSWDAIRHAPGGVEKWFASGQGLEERLVDEARKGLSVSRNGAHEPASLTAALQLVNAYQLATGCARSAVPGRDCKRAAELRQMLETSGPLVARRRAQEVWTTECSTLNDAIVQRWLADLPLAHLTDSELRELTRALTAKLATCFLRDSTHGWSLSAWGATQLPKPEAVTRQSLPVYRELETAWRVGTPLDRCARAVRAVQTLDTPKECSLPNALREHLIGNLQESAPVAGSSFELAICGRLLRALWSGESAAIAGTFPTIPTIDDVVRTLPNTPASNMQRLRMLCEQRVGRGQRFETAVRELAGIGHALGESSLGKPWNLDQQGRPVEAARALRAAPLSSWLHSLVSRGAACRILELSEARCRACKTIAESEYYDCSLLSTVNAAWEQRTRTLLLRISAILGLAGLVLWAYRLRRAIRNHQMRWTDAVNHMQSIGFVPKPDRLRYLLPSRWEHLGIELPSTAAWERWGTHAAMVWTNASQLQEREINRAAGTAQSLRAELVILVHDESSSVGLGAIRSMLEWSARGGARSVNVLPISWARLRWSHGPNDLLELAEESSLRSNPFEVRGRITSSTQFFNRERLVSGLLAGTQAGHFLVITGLRRFGKSSLALEVARRLPGPSAYVDLAGFHHEIRNLADPTLAVDAILRFLCLKLTESARALYGDSRLTIEVPAGAIDAASLARWFAAFFDAVAKANRGRTPPALLILDEIEQAIGAANELNHALEVFAVLVGRLRNSLPGTSHEHGPRVGILFCSAVHPLLWSPLGTLAHQSLIGCYEHVAVPCLPEEAATSMMRGLGSRQGVRFTDAAVQLLVAQSQGVPLLVRRLGSAVLELYDPERARQGALGAVEVGIEGVRAALEREESEGSPTRVWVESEIAEPHSPGGAVLRHLALHDAGTATELRAIAARAFWNLFEITGVASALTSEESERRAQEAAAVVIRMLGDSGLLEIVGDQTEPEGYVLPDGVIRRVLSKGPEVSS
ncbi:MAG TPA: ATP-binding protein [Polyangiaceae bacterium]|nr:ATP-binding protein [Polyangiaceae bacterium]